MNESYEPSYYEIALTGRQVLTAFVVLLVCLVAAFFSGLWVGRDGAAGGREAEGPEAARVEDPGEARPEELSFFDEDAGEEPADRPRNLPEAAREPRPESTLREDLGDGGGGEVPSESRRPAPEEAAGAGTRAPEEPASSRQPRTDANPSGSLATGDVVIQVLVSSEEDKAREILDRLERNGFRAFLSPVTDDGRTLFRVRVGPFEQKAEAERVAAELRRTLNLETWITQ